MVTTFKVHNRVNNVIYVLEYWDTIPVTEYEVLFPSYSGGFDLNKIIGDNQDIIKKIINDNDSDEYIVNRCPLYYGIREYLRRHDEEILKNNKK